MANVVFWVLFLLGAAILGVGIFPDALLPPDLRDTASSVRIMGAVICGVAFIVRRAIARQEFPVCPKCNQRGDPETLRSCLAKERCPLQRVS